MGFLLKHWEFVVACVISLVGIVLAIQSRRSKVLLYTMWSNNLVENWQSRLPLLDIQYDGKPVENLTVTRIPLWNAGSGVVEKDSIADADRLRVTAKNGCDILDASIVLSTSAAGQLACDRDDAGTRVMVGFDFLNSGDGALFQIIHTGRSSDDLGVSGTVKGGRLTCAGIVTPLSHKARWTMTLVLLLACLFITPLTVQMRGIGPRDTSIARELTTLHKHMEGDSRNLERLTSLHAEREAHLHRMQVRATSHKPTSAEVSDLLEMASLHSRTENDLHEALALARSSKELDKGLRTLRAEGNRIFGVLGTFCILADILAAYIIYRLWFSISLPPRAFQASARLEL